MPMGIVSDEEFDQEINNSSVQDQPPVAPEILYPDTPGRKPGDNNVPDSLRKIIGEESIIHGRASALEIARMFGVSDSSVSAYAKGATSTDTYHKPEKGLQNYLRNRKERITKKAMHKLVNALDQITPDRLSQVSVKDASSIAKDMAAVVKNMEDPKVAISGDQQNNQFVFYAPQFRTEGQYQTVDARE